MFFDDKFQDDIEDILDRRDGRRYKREVSSAMTRNTLINTAGWNETFKRWRDNKDKLISVARKLIEVETLEGKELAALFA